MKRGDLVTIAMSGAYGKPRPALVVQSDDFIHLPSVTVLQLTSDVHDDHVMRITIQPSARNGLRHPSQIMVDRAVSLPRRKVGPVFGQVDKESLVAVSLALSAFFELGRYEARSA